MRYFVEVLSDPLDIEVEEDVAEEEILKAVQAYASQHGLHISAEGEGEDSELDFTWYPDMDRFYE